MARNFTFLILALALAACSGLKKNQKNLARGNYDEAISIAVKKLQKDKNSDKYEEHIPLLESAFARAVADDEKRLAFLNQEGNPLATREIYNIHLRMERRQNLLRPLLPLRGAQFKMVDYGSRIIDSKNDLAKHLYNQGEGLLARNNTMDARKAHSFFQELNRLQPQYPGAQAKLDEAHFKGTDFVLVKLQNRSGTLIPKRLHDELMDFSTYGLDDFWTVYHASAQSNLDYHFEITLDLQAINVAPERILEREFRREIEVKDGWEYLKNSEGQIVKDSLGNKIKVDVYRTKTAFVKHIAQTKAVQVAGTVYYKDLDRNQRIGSYPLSSEYLFENVFAQFQGDAAALTAEDHELLRCRFVPFPSNELMVLDAGDDLKARFKYILKNSSIRG